MKRLLVLLLLGTTIQIWGFSQTKVVISTFLYEKADITSKRIATIDKGEMVQLGQQDGDFWQATYKGSSGYIPGICLENYVPQKTEREKAIDLQNARLMNDGRTPGDELVSAGRLVIGGVFISITGSAIAGVWGSKAESFKDLKKATYFGMGVGVTALIFEVVGLSKLIKAGKKFNLGMTSSGIGMMINLN